MFQNFKVLRKNALMIRDFGAILKQRRIVAPFDGTSVHAPWVEMLFLARARPEAKPRRPAGGVLRPAAAPWHICSHLHRTAPQGGLRLWHILMAVPSWTFGAVQVLVHWLIGTLAHWLTLAPHASARCWLIDVLTFAL